MILELAYYGDPILRKKGAPITEFNDELKALVNDMIDTMHAKNGMGLAAPQIHRSLTLFICKVPELGPDDKVLPGELRIFVNPKVLSVGENTWIYEEGCLSIPSLYEDVERPIEITIEAQDLDGNRFEEKLHGLKARAFLHENDHINGVLFIDRIRGKKRKDLEPKLREIKKKYSKSK